MKTVLRSPGDQSCCLFQTSRSHFEAFFFFLEAGAPGDPCCPSAARREAAALGERSVHLLRQSRNSRQVRHRQPALSGKLWVCFLIQGAATKWQGYD